MSQVPHPRSKRRKTTKTLSLVAAVVVAVGLLATFPAILDSMKRQNNHAELNAALRHAQPLQTKEASRDCFLTTPLKGRDVILVLTSPDQKQWWLVRKIGLGVALKDVRDGLTQEEILMENSDRAEELQIYRTGPHLDFFCPGSKAVSVRLGTDWQAWLVGQPKVGPGPLWTVTPFRSIVQQDSFTRTAFGQNDGWTVEEGSFHTQMHGGGEGKSANASGLEVAAAGGLVPTARTGWQHSANYCVEVSALAASPQACYQLEAGNPNTARVSFGWDGKTSSWVLLFRSTTGQEQALLSRAMALPQSNWARIGLRFDSPLQVSPLLDGMAFGSFALPEPVYGQVRLRAKNGKVCFDDFDLHGRDAAPDRGGRMFVKSKSFVDKPVEAGKDADFVKWAHDTLSYEETKLVVDGQPVAAYRYKAPVYGDFTYESALKAVGRIILRLEHKDGYRDFEFRRAGEEWRPASVAQPAATQTDLSKPAVLQLSFRDGQLYQQMAGEQRVGEFSAPGPLSLTLCTPGAAFNIEQHDVRSVNLRNEFFEDTPAAWRWWTGEFGMQYRWQCQPQWNWMGGWSRTLAVCFTRDAYQGDQIIDYYICLKDLMGGLAPVNPNRRYMRRELNFSFCTDGRNVSSGYSFLLGGRNDAGTYLMKGTQVLASTDQVRLPPFAGTHGDVHWRWWHVRAEKRGGLITVSLDEQKLFEVTDPKPLDGGHLAFWSVGNGFLLARVQVAAQKSESGAQQFWCEPSYEGGLWEPVEPGAVTLKPPTNFTGVVNRVGGGTFAVRWTGGKVDLARTPVLRMAFQPGPNAKVNMHIQVSGKPFVIPITAPVENTPFVLCPVWFATATPEALLRTETQTELPAESVLPAVSPKNGSITVDLAKALAGKVGASPVLEGLIIGNSSNKDYLMAGFSGNGAGTQYCVGVPVWLPRRQ